MTERKTPWLRFALATLATGVAGGLSGAALVVLLHFVQRVAYGYDLDPLTFSQTFLQGASAASPARRVAVLAVCGGVAGGGWWALYRFGRSHVVNIEAAVRDSTTPRIPVLETTINAVLQIVTVALGSPVGREGAPRELAAALTARLSERMGLGDEERRVLIACGAGAGLSAVYDVPVGGALFVLEGLLGTLRLRTLLPAVVTSVLGAATVRVLLGSDPQYVVDHFPVSASLIVYALVAGPIFGLAGTAFAAALLAARSAAPRDGRLLLACPVVFVAIGLAAVAYPQILGNGKGAVQLGFSGVVGVQLGVVLLLLRTVAPLATFRAGAIGGSLTPALAIGALIAILLGAPWSRLWPGVPEGAFAVVGATAFLAASMRMPLTALVVTAELARVDAAFLLPMLCAVAGSAAVAVPLSRRLGRDSPSPTH